VPFAVDVAAARRSPASGGPAMSFSGSAVFAFELVDSVTTGTGVVIATYQPAGG
jgi:hypothetical protein